ncbi:MAG: tyrosine-type recombinase/integrase [Desulfitobacteriaceae bacterium]
MAGNIVKVKEGSYRLRYKDYTRNVTAKSDRAAETLLAKFITEVEAGDFTQPSKVTFNEFVKRWLKDYAEPTLAPKTLVWYKQLLEARILPSLGEKKLEKIKPIDITAFYGSLRTTHKYVKVYGDGRREERTSKGLSDKTIRHHHGIICAIFEKAIKWQIFKGDNPVHHVDAPKVERKKANCYDLDQANAMLKALEQEDIKHRIAVMLALTTGARLGEIMGLEWQDIDFKSKTLEIRQASQYLPGKGVFLKAPKTETSKRKMSVHSDLLKLLEAYKANQQEKGFLCADNNRLFVTWDGKPMHPGSMSKWFPKFLTRNKLPRIKFHELRHTNATFLISQGIDVQTVAGRLGHSTSVTTQNIYSHYLQSKDKQVADLMEKTFSLRNTAT